MIPRHDPTAPTPERMAADVFRRTLIAMALVAITARYGLDVGLALSPAAAVASI